MDVTPLNVSSEYGEEKLKNAFGAKVQWQSPLSLIISSLPVSTPHILFSLSVVLLVM